MTDYTLQIVQNPTTYAFELSNEPRSCGTDAWKEARPFHLWQITLWNPVVGCWLAPIFVLAPTRESAVSQASCKGRMDAHQIDMEFDQWNAEVAAKSKCEQLPFLIPGWSSNEF